MEKIVSIEEIIPRSNGYIWKVQVAGGSTYVLNGIIVLNSEVEHGVEAHEEIVRAHTYSRRHAKRAGHRRKRGTTIIHVRTFTRFMPARKGVFYLTRAFREGIQYLSKDVGFYLKNLGRVR